MIHSTSAGGLVLNTKGEVLVVSQGGTTWSLPKGHIDPGENALEAAKREIHEESGVDRTEFLRELGSYQRHKIGENDGDDTSEMKTIVMFLFKTDVMELKPIDPHNPEARWVPRDQVAALLTHRKDKEFFTSVLPSL